MARKAIRKTVLVLAMVLAFSIGAGFCHAQDYSQLEYKGKAYEAVNDNVPFFTDKQKSKAKSSFESYGSLDSLGRCTAATASIGLDIMPKGERGDISQIHPTGWQSGMGWERCHLIGWQLTGEDANQRNLITGTHYFNVTGMLPFENMVDDYIEENPKMHVLYRVTPVFRGDELVARGVLMEGWSVEDKGEDICFNVYVFNVDPDAYIDYNTGYVSEDSQVFSYESGYLTDADVPDYDEDFFRGVIGSAAVTVIEAAYQVSDAVESDEDAVVQTVNGAAEDDEDIADNGSNDISSGTVYWTPSGSVYHVDRDCPSLANSKTVLSGTISESGKPRVCKRCGD